MISPEGLRLLVNPDLTPKVAKAEANNKPKDKLPQTEVVFEENKALHEERVSLAQILTEAEFLL